MVIPVDTLTPNFDWSEFGAPQDMRPAVYELALILEIVRTAAGDHPIEITSGYRSPEANARVDDAATRSLHTKAKAADFRIRSGPYAEPERTQDLLESLIAVGAIPDGGLGRYDRHTHYDIGPPGRRWSGKSSG